MDFVDFDAHRSLIMDAVMPAYKDGGGGVESGSLDEVSSWSFWIGHGVEESIFEVSERFHSYLLFFIFFNQNTSGVRKADSATHAPTTPPLFLGELTQLMTESINRGKISSGSLEVRTMKYLFRMDRKPSDPQTRNRKYWKQNAEISISISSEMLELATY